MKASQQNGPKKLKPEQLGNFCSENTFAFKSTADIEPLDKIVGQERAMKALELGVSIKSPGYNVFVSGLSGTGRLTTIQHILEKMRPKNPALQDFCYVNNFKDEDKPRLVTLAKGQGIKFKKSMQVAIKYLRHRIPQMFESEQFLDARKKMIAAFQEKERKLLNDFDQSIRPKNFVLGQVQLGNVVQPEVMPIIEGKPVPIEEIDEMVNQGKMSIEDAKKWSDTYQQLKDEFIEIAKHGVKLSQDFQREIEEFEKQSAELIVSSVIDSRRAAFPNAEVRAFLNEVEDNILSHLALFKAPAGQGPRETPEEQEMPVGDDAQFRMFSVNLLLDNSQANEAPVIIETQPNYNNIFGTIEKVYDARGVWVSDFTKIKAGSLLRANGGYLIINALDALTEPGVWKTLKRVLLHRKIEIQPVDMMFQVMQTALKPEAIPTNVKVLIIGDEDIYDALYQYEEDFKKIFKINATFDYEMDRSKTAMLDYAKFIRRLGDEENLLPFSRDGVAAVINYSVRRAGRQRKLTTQFSDVADLVRESHYFAYQSRARVVTAAYVEKALTETVKRNGMLNDKLQEMIEENTMLIDTSGDRVGQINGLAVYQLANTMFGKPSRITASVGVGSAGIINIERESKLSGSTHDKGVLILAGYFREKFASDKPLTFSASLCFEQSYSGVDGDSASSTEIYALLSALSGVPIKQQFAVTGSVNQKGDIQPIGGVNEKIEGFFDVCNARGLTGTQGVLIPYQNVEDLMLKDEVRDAVKKNKFSIYPVRTIDEGIGILTGVKAGKKINGKFEQDSLNYLVDKRLREFSELMKESPEKSKKAKDKKEGKEKKRRK